MQTVNIEIAKENLAFYQNNVLKSNDEVKIVSEFGSTVLISEQDWNQYKGMMVNKNIIDSNNFSINNVEKFNKKDKNKLELNKLELINILENLFNEMISENELNFELEKNIFNVFLSSKQNFLNFIENFDSEFIANYTPEYAIDSEGEIMLEWYGRIGARINLTFGRNGELYFISLMHGQITKSKLFINSFTFAKIESELIMLFKDKELN